MAPVWNTASLEEFAATCSGDLSRQFVEQMYATRLLGGDPAFALHGGGNTSFKSSATDPFGEPVETLFVKVSGCDMALAGPDDFVTLDLVKLRKLDRDGELDDAAMNACFRSAMVHFHPRKPSIETLLHAFLPFTCVDHTHPDAILSLTNRSDADACIGGVFAGSVAVLPYATVGVGLARAVAQAVRATPGCRGVVIGHHGLVTWGSDAREAFDVTVNLVAQAEKWLAAHRKTGIVQSAASDHSSSGAESAYLNTAPVLRSCLTPEPDGDGVRPVISLEYAGDDELLALIGNPSVSRSIVSTPVTPDYIIRIRRLPLFIDDPKLDDPEVFRKQLTDAINAWRKEYDDFVTRLGGDVTVHEYRANLLPRVVIIRGLGIVCAGATAGEARRAMEITRHGLNIKRSIMETGGDYLGLDDDHCFNMEFRSYQRAKLTRTAAGGRLAGRIVLVTGAAGAIGSGICTSLLEKGCQVAVSDLSGAALDTVVGEFTGTYGPDNVLSVPMDVTDEASVRDGFATIIRRFGGIDGVVVNAGIAHVASLATLELDAFRRLERVNTDGTLLTIREAARLFTLQGTGGDIILISTKNVFAPGASFGAYSATKAAAHQLARIASLELAPVDVRVNMVAPDAVFSHGTHKSGLWATVGPGRMKSRGLDEAGLEEYYRNRNLLKAKVTAPHVAAAVEFFLERRTPTTGATIPVDGGLPDATPR